MADVIYCSAQEKIILRRYRDRAEDIVKKETLRFEASLLC